MSRIQGGQRCAHVRCPPTQVSCPSPPHPLVTQKMPFTDQERGSLVKVVRMVFGTVGIIELPPLRYTTDCISAVEKWRPYSGRITLTAFTKEVYLQVSSLYLGPILLEIIMEVQNHHLF